MTSHADQLGLCVGATAAAFQASLAPLPSVVRYFDEFTEQTHSIRDLANAEFIHLALDGQKHRLDFRAFRPLEHVLKHVVVDWLNRLDPHTASIYANCVRRYVLRSGTGSLANLVAGTPYEARAYWNAIVVGDVTAPESWALRALMHSLCRLNIGHWTSHAASIVKSLPSPKVDKYRVVRAGDCFVPLDQQALIVNHIDELVGSLAVDPASLPDDRLRNACMLVMS